MGEKVIDALNSVCWYNRYDDIVKDIMKHIKEYDHESGSVSFPGYDNKYECEEDKIMFQILWMLCVLQYGDYGTSPRSGWVEDREGAIAFLEKLIADRQNEIY